MNCFRLKKNLPFLHRDLLYIQSNSRRLFSIVKYKLLKYNITMTGRCPRQCQGAATKNCKDSGSRKYSKVTDFLPLFRLVKVYSTSSSFSYVGHSTKWVSCYKKTYTKHFMCNFFGWRIWQLDFHTWVLNFSCCILCAFIKLKIKLYWFFFHYGFSNLVFNCCWIQWNVTIELSQFVMLLDHVSVQFCSGLDQ